MKSRPNGPKFCRDPLWGLKPWPTKFESHCFKTVALRQSQSFSSCPLLLVILSQNLERASRIVATEIFFLKWLRSCSNFVRGISVMKLSEKLHTTMGLKCTILWSEPSQYFLLSTFVGGTQSKFGQGIQNCCNRNFFSQMAQILLKLCQGLLTDETRRKASYNHGSKVLYSLVRAISKAQSCPLLLVGLSQNLEKASRIVAMEIFFLKCLRSGWDMTRTFV